MKPSRMTPKTMPLTHSMLSDLVSAHPPLATAGNAFGFGRPAAFAARCIFKTRASARLLAATALAALGAALAPQPAAAAAITWGPATTISGDSDVAINGPSIYAYTGGAAGATVNGVGFTAGNSGTTWGSVSLSGFGTDNTTAFGSGSGSPWSTLSTAYQTVLAGAAYGGATAGTVTLNGLISGHSYSVQIWANDNRGGGEATRSETASSTGGNTITLAYEANQTLGGVGQYAIGTFVADSTSQSFTLTPSASGSVQLNAINVLDTSGAIAIWTGASSTYWGTAGNWGQAYVPFPGEPVMFNASSSANLTTLLDASYTIGTLTLSNAPAPVSIGYDGNTLTISGGINLLGAGQSLTNSDPLVLGASQTWNVTNNAYLQVNTAGVSGNAALTITGGGTVDFQAAATYTGNTTISGGRLVVDNGSSIASPNINVATNSTFALSGSGSLSGTTNILMAGGATFDVSALSSSPIVFSGTLTASSTGAVINGANDCSTATLSLPYYDGVNPPFLQTNGTMTLSGSTVININNTGAVLGVGNHTIIAAAQLGNVGQVVAPSGLPSTVNLTGNGAVGNVTLNIDGAGDLQLVVAAADEWTGGGTPDNNWTTAANWSPASVPNALDWILFDTLSTQNLNTVLNQDFVTTGLSIVNPAGPVTIGGGNNLELGTGGINMSSASQDLTISAPLTVPDNANWNIAAGRHLNINGGATGSSGPTIVGAGTVNLNSPVTFQGATTVASGSALKMTTPNVLPNGPSTGDLAINGLLDLNGQSEAMNALSGSGVVDNTGGAAVTLTMGANGDTGAFNGILQNTGGALALQVVGGTLALTSPNSTYSGGTTFTTNNTGGNGGTLGTAASASLGTGPVTFNPGSGSYTFGCTFPNALFLTDCSLRIGGNNDVQIWSGPVTVTNGFQMSGDNANAQIYLSGPMYIGTGGISVTNTGNNGPNGGSGAAAYGDLIAGPVSGSGGIFYELDGGNSRLTVQGANTYSGGTIVSGTSNGKLNIVGGSNPFSTGSLTLNAGAIIEAYNGNATITNALILNGGTLESEPYYNNYNTLTWTGPITLTADSSLVQFATGALNNNQSSGVNVNGSLNINGFTLTCSSPVAVYGGNTINGSISGSGNIIVNENTLQLNGSNTFSGTFRAASGTLGVGNVYAMQSATLDMNATDAGAVSLNNLNQVIGALTGTRNLALGTTNTVSLGNNTPNTYTYNGTLSGNALIKIGTDTQVFASPTSYGGSTTVKAGTLSFAYPSLPLFGTVSVSNGAALNLNFAGTNAVVALVLNGVSKTTGFYNSANSGGLITGTGTIQVGAYPFIWTGALSGEWSVNQLPAPMNWKYNSGSANYSDGSAVLFDDTLTANSTVNISLANVSPALVSFNNNVANYTIGGNFGIAGPCALIKSGSGTVALNTTNSFTGFTTISNGVLTIGGLGMGSGSYAGNITNNGTLNFTNANAQTLSGTISGTGAINDSDSASMTLSGANTFSGGFNMLPGAGNVGTGPVINGLGVEFGTGPVTMTSGTYGVYSGIYAVATVTYTNNLTANGALLRVGGAGNHTMTWSGPIILSTNGIKLGGDGSAGAITLAGNIYVSSPTSTITSFAGESFGGVVSGGISGNGSVLTVNNPGAGLALNGPISGTMSLYADAGTVSLGTANTFTGSLRAGAGSVTVGNALALQNATLDMNAADGGAVTFSQASTLGALMGNNSLASGYILSVGNNNASTTYSGGLSGTGGLNKIGTGTLTLSGGNTYTNATIVSGGALVLNGGSLASTNFTVAGGATFDVSASPLTLVSSSTLANTSVGAVLGGAINASVGTLPLVYDGVHPSFIQSNGTLTVSSSTVFTVNNMGPTLMPGSYTIISGATTGNPGSVSAGALTQSVVVTGSGAVGFATLQISGANLNLVIGSPLAWTGASGTTWSNGGNWTTAAAPTNGAIVNFNGSSTANLATVLSSNVNLYALNLLNPSAAVSIGGTYTLTVTNGISLAVATTNLTITAPVVLGAAQAWTVTNTRTLSVNSNVSGSAALTVLGGGTVSLNGTNTYTGVTTINGGNLNLNGLLTNSSVTVSNGGTFKESAVGVITGGGTFTQNSTNTSTLGGSNTFTGPITVSTGELDITNWGATGLAGPTVGNAPTTATLGILGGTLALGGNTFVIGSGSSSAYVGIVNQTGGTVSFTNGTATLLGNGIGSVGIYNLSGGTFTSGAYSSTTRGVMLGVNNNCTGIFNLSGTGVLSFPLAELQVGRNDSAVLGGTAVYTQNGGAATFGYLAIGGASTAFGTTATFAITNGTFVATNFQTLAGAPNNSATLYLGGGAQVTLPAFPTRAGTANITFDFTNGFLSPVAASASFLPAGTFNNAYLTTNGVNFNVASLTPITVGQSLINAPSQAGTLTKSGLGMLTLSGLNTYSGLTTVSAGELKLQTGGSGASSITVAAGATNGVLVASAGGQWISSGNLTNQNGSVLHIDYSTFAASTTVAPMQVANFTLGTGLTLTISAVPANLPSGQYPLLTWTGSGPANPNAFTALVLPASHIFGNLSVSGNTLYLNVTANTEPLSWNTGNGAWDTTTTTSWVDSTSAPTTYLNGDQVVFDDASGVTLNPTVTLNSLLLPLGVTMKSASHNYSISGTGGIGGSTPLTLDPANTMTLTLATSNSYTGGTVVNAGTLALGNANALGSGTLTLSGGNLDSSTANLVNSNNNAQNWNADFTFVGSQNLSLGTGAVTPSANRQVTVTANILTVGGTIGGGAISLTKAGTGTLALTAANTYSGATAVSGGTLRLGPGGTLGSGTYAGAISLASGATLECTNVSAGQTFSGAITGAGALTADAVAGQTLTLSSTANTYSGLTTVANGMRIAAAPADLSPNTTLNLVGNSSVGGQLYLSAAGTVPNNMTLSGVGFADSGINFGAIRSGGNTFSGVLTLTGTGNARIGSYAAAGATITGQLTGTGGVEFLEGDSANSQNGIYTLQNSGTANNYNGNTVISCSDYNSGNYTGCKCTLKLGASEQIPNGAGDGLLVFNGANANHISVLEMNGFSETVNGLSNVAAVGAIIQNTTAGASTLTIGDGNTSSSYSGVITDGGTGKTLTLTKIGSGLLTLSGVNTYIGATTISAGELVGATGGSCSNSAFAVSSGATNGVQVLAASGRWACGALTYSAGTTYADFNFGGFAPSTTTAPLQVTNALTFTGTPAISLRNLGPVTNGVYPLIKYGTVSGTLPTTFTSANVSGTIVNSNTISTLYLVVNNGGNVLLWAAGNGPWDINATPDWKNPTGTTGLNYLDGDYVTFDDTASGASPIALTLNTTVNPGSVTANLTNKNYTISGSGTIAGATGLTKNGTGTLTLSGASTYTGGTTINAGMVKFAGASSLPATGLITVATNGTIDLGGQSLATTGLVTLQGGSTLQNGTLTCNNAGEAGNNQFTGSLTNGTGAAFVSNQRLLLANTASGSLTLAGSGSMTFGGDNGGNMNYVAVGAFTSVLTLNGSTMNFTNSTVGTGNGWLNIGNNTANANGSIVVNGGTMNVGTWLKLGGIYNTAQGLTSTSALTITNNGSVTVGGGSAGTNGILFMDGAIGDITANTGVATLTVGSGGTLTVAQIQTGTSGTNTIILNGGTIVASAGATNSFLNPAPGLTVNVQNGGVTINSGTNSIQIGAALTANGTGGLTKTGAGTLTLTNASTYTGGTIINGGTLLANNTSGTGTGTGAVNINTGGTLGGTGIISGAVTNNAGGILLPGVSGSGTLTVSNYLTLTSGSTNTFAVNGSTPANTSVALAAPATVTYGGVLNLVTNGTFTIGQTFTLFSGPGATNTGNFASLAGSPGAGMVFSFTNGVLSVISSAPTLTSVSPNPVTGSSYPVTLGLTGSGFTGATAVLLTNVTAAAGASYVPVVNNNTSISVSFVPGTAANNWNATVVNGGASAQVPFTVAAPTQASINSTNANSAGAGKLVLSGTGGAAGNSYAVQSATNLTPPIVWVPVVTNVFGAGGSFSYTNTVNTNIPSLFLRIAQ